jgi:hypothetical protein
MLGADINSLNESRRWLCRGNALMPTVGLGLVSAPRLVHSGPYQRPKLLEPSYSLASWCFDRQLGNFLAVAAQRFCPSLIPNLGFHLLYFIPHIPQLSLLGIFSQLQRFLISRDSVFQKMYPMKGTVAHYR